MCTPIIKASVGKLAPYFKAIAVDGTPSKNFVQKSLQDYKSKWLLLFFYPKDFTYICPTQILDFSLKAKDFKQIGCQILGCSTDTQFCHLEFIKKPRNQGGLGNLQIPLLADVDKKISDAYGVLNDGGVCFRGTFIIDQTQVVRHMSINDLPVGRNVDEYLRLVKAFMHFKTGGGLCPSSWKPGQRTIIANDSQKLESYWKQVHAKK